MILSYLYYIAVCQFSSLELSDWLSLHGIDFSAVVFAVVFTVKICGIVFIIAMQDLHS